MCLTQLHHWSTFSRKCQTPPRLLFATEEFKELVKQFRINLCLSLTSALGNYRASNVLKQFQSMMSQPAEIDPLSITYERYDPKQEVTQLEAIRSMISTDLSEPYSIYVYRYFLYQWGDLCYMVRILPSNFGNASESSLTEYC